MRPLISVRQLSPLDMDAASELTYLAFTREAERNGRESPFVSTGDARRLIEAYFDLDPDGAFVAENRGALIGAAFLHLRGNVAAIGPVSAHPSAPAGVGRALMERLIACSAHAGSVRLFHDADNVRSFALYAKFGFRVAETAAICTHRSPRELAARVRTLGSERVTVNLAGSRELQAAIADDERLSGISRARDLELLARLSRPLWAELAGQPAGHLFRYTTVTRTCLGPASANSASALLSLVLHAAIDAPLPISVRVPVHEASLITKLLEVGFHVEHLGHVLVRGQSPKRPGFFLYAQFPESL